MSDPTEHPDRLPELDSDEVAQVIHWARRIKAGERKELFADEEGRLCSQPIDRGRVERACSN